MKKLFTLMLCFALALFSFGIATGCEKDNRLIRLNEVTHSIFYAPMYIAINKGYFTELDIRISLTNGQGATNVMTAIASNSADIGLMGPEATV